MGIFKSILLTGNSGGGYEEYQTCQVDQQQQRNHQKKLSEASRSYSTGKLSKLDAIYISYCFPIDSKSGRTTKHFDISTYANFEFCILPQQSYIACLCEGLLGKRNRVNSFCYYKNFLALR